MPNAYTFWPYIRYWPLIALLAGWLQVMWREYCEILHSIREDQCRSRA